MTNATVPTVANSTNALTLTDTAWQLAGASPSANTQRAYLSALRQLAL